jgi:integrase
MPGGPYVPPPCRRCGRTEGYYSAGLCDRCHRHAPQTVTACTDCHAWGVSRLNGWLCTGCRHWRKQYPVGICRACSETVAVNADRSCRLCWSQFLASGGKKGGADLLEVNRFGQQLSLANLRHAAVGRRRGSRRDRPKPETGNRDGAAPVTFRPVPHRQLLLFEAERDLREGRIHGFPAPANPQMAAFLSQFLVDHAARHGWRPSAVKEARRGLAVVLSLQDTPGAPVRATEILQLHQIRINALRLLDVCAAAGLLEDDREPAVDRWFNDAIAELPPQMRNELRRWYAVMTHGSKVQPRSKPRSENTIRLYLRWSLPALHFWAAAGHTSLREISPDDLKAVLPESGNPRAAMGRGLRCVFRILKAHGVVFLNPLNRLRVGAPQPRHPLPLPPAVLREALSSANPAQAALTALAAFHGLRSGQLRKLLLTDIHSGRLHLDGRVIPLAPPVRNRLTAWHSYRDQRWPQSANQHLFISKRTALGTGPVGVRWITQSIGMTTQAIREDRILHELLASGGDLRRICDLFGLTIYGAKRYAATLSHPDLASH